MERIISPGFSIVICTYNGTPRLNPTLSYIAALKIPSGCFVELIVVNNASTDDTAQFVKDQWNRLGTPFPLTVLMKLLPVKATRYVPVTIMPVII